MQSLVQFFSPRASSQTSPKKHFNPVFQSPQTKKKDENYNIDVLCTNCQEMINVNEIDKHSMTCCKVSEKVFQIENNLSVNQIEYKLSKLKEALHNHIRMKHNFADSANEEKCAREIIDLIDKILSFEHQSDLKKIKALKELLSHIQIKLDGFRGSTALLLYLERVKLLGKEKYRELIKQDQESISNWKEQLNLANSLGSNDITPSTNSSMTSAQPNLGVEYNSKAPGDHEGIRFSTNKGMSNLHPHTSYQTFTPEEDLASQYFSNKKYNPTIVNSPSPYSQSKPPYVGQYGNDNFQSQNTFVQPFDISKKKNQIHGSNQKNIPNINTNFDEINKNSFYPNQSSRPEEYNSFDPRFSFQNLRTNERLYYENSNNDIEQSRGSQKVSKSQLETRLELTKKEYSEVTKLVDTYKKKTELIQNTINMTPYGSTQTRLVSTSPPKKTVQFDLGSPSSQSRNQNASDYQDRRFRSTDNRYIKFRNNMIEEIESDTEAKQYSSKFSETQETTSNISKSGFHPNYREEPDFENIDQNYEFEAFKDATQEEQRLFYSRCLAIKLKLKSQDLAQIVPVSLIYRDALQKKIPEKDWDIFIENAFRNPENYVDPRKVQKKKRHGFKNNLAEIAKTKVIPKKNKDNFHNIDVIYE